MTTANAHERQQAIDHECARQSLSHWRSIALSTFVLATLVALIVHDRVPRTRLIVWLGATYVMVAVRVAFSAAYARRRRSDAELRRWLSAMTVTLSISSSVWGCLIFVSGRTDDVLMTATTTLFIGGLIAGGAQSISATPKVLMAIGFFSVTPLLVALVCSGTPENRYIAITAVVYLTMVAQFGRRNHRLLRESIALRFGNLDLVESLTVEKRRAEEARDEAERATAAKNQFLAAASHDIRQPVHATFLFLGALENERRATPALLEKLRASLVAVRQMLDALLDVSRLDAGVVERWDRSIDVECLAARLRDVFVPVAERKGLTLSLRSPRGLWVHSDPDLCQRILSNLVSNAIKYTDSGVVLVAFRRRKTHCLVQVWDTGIGIREDEHDVIFDEFKQLNNPERDGSRGIGLGLSIVRRLCALLGTRIDVRSKPGRGSVFSFSLPLGEPAEPAQTSALVALDDHRARLIVVDDNALIRDGLTALLHTWGYETYMARDVESARRVAAEQGPLDLALVDYRLPGEETARDAIDAIREVCGRPVPAIIITGDTHPQRIRDASASGFPVIFKPVPAEVLHDTLRRVLDASRDARSDEAKQ